MIRIIFPNGFPVSPPPVPLAMSCFVPVLRFLRFAWNDGNKKIDFPNDIYPSVGKRDILRVAHYHARFYSPSLVWTHHFDRCEFSHCSSQKVARFTCTARIRTWAWGENNELNGICIVNLVGKLYPTSYIVYHNYFRFLMPSYWKNTQTFAIRKSRDFKFSLKLAWYHMQLGFI